VADTVIVVGVRRARERVPASELRQMVGRAGRRHDGGTSQAIILVEEDDEEEVRTEMSDDGSLTVTSMMGDVDTLAFHILPEVCSGTFTEVEHAEKWYSRSFSAFQKGKLDFAKAFKKLEEFGSIKWDGGYAPTEMGSIASRLYFHPADVKAWHENFTQMFRMGVENDDVAIAWALGNVPVTRYSGDFGNHWGVIDECRARIPPGLDVNKGCIQTIVLWWNVLGGLPVGKMKNQALALRLDSGRICRALGELGAKVSKWNMGDFFESLEFRAKRGIPSHLAGLCFLKGITKSRALWLYNRGVRDEQGIKDLLEETGDEIDDDFMSALRAIANGVS